MIDILSKIGLRRNEVNCKDRVAKILDISSKCKETDKLESEEATKMALILPLISALGYDIHDNNEVIAEYVADVGVKRGEKADYVIQIDGEPAILVEAKRLGEDLNKAVSQLFRYFSVTPVQVGIITDGVRYLFFTDSEKDNVMDTEPYMYINMRKVTELEIDKLLKYSKEKFSRQIIKEHIAYERLYGTVSNLVNSILDEDVDDLLFEHIQNVLGTKIDSVETINMIIRQELKDIAERNENVARAVESKRRHGETNQLSSGVNEYPGESRSGLREIGEENVHGYKIDYAMVFGVKYDKISYANLLVEVLNAIYRLDQRFIDRLLRDNDFNTERYSKIATDINKIRKPREIECLGVYVETHLGGADIVKLIIQILDKCNVGHSQVKIALYR